MSLNVLTRGAGPPILLLHGFTGTALTWSDQLEAWAPEHRVIAPDLLGHGASASPVEPAAYTLARQAGGLARLLELLDAAPATVVGYSMGARLALVLALEQPAVVERLVLESPSPGIAEPAERAARCEADARLAASIERDGVDAFATRWEAMPLFASHSALPAAVQERQRAQRRRHTAAGLAGSLRGAGQGVMTPLHDRLPHIGVPALVVTGSLDVTGRERAGVVAEGLPEARLAVIDGAGHTPHLERPHQFIRITNEFLRTSHVTA